MALSSKTGWQKHGRGSWLACLLLALLLHALTLALLQRALQPPSLLRDMVAPLYTRTIVPEAPAPVAEPALAAAAVSKSNRPTAVIRQARPAIKKRARPASAPAAAATALAAAAPEPPASAALAEPPPVDQPPSPELQPPQQDASAPPPAALAAASEPASAAAPEPVVAAAASEPVAATASQPAAAASAPAPEPAFLAGWPADTRLTYTLGGNYRGALHGNARVLWQRTGTRYQAVVEMSAGLLASLTLSSQGQITAAGLYPEVYQEDTRNHRRGVQLGEEEVRLKNGQRLPRPEAVQDTASQFVELAHRFATGQTPPTAGGQIRVTLARPGGIDDWVYDVVGQETLYLPRLGPVAAWHLKPRPLDQPRGPLTAEMWFAPALQYLPVRIRITQDADTYLDLLVETIEQK